MRWRRQHKNNNRVKAVQTSWADFAECREQKHYMSTWQYGSHPARVYILCPYHDPPRSIVLEWKDPRARWGNRVSFSLPIVVSLTTAAIFIGAVVFYVIQHFNP